MENKKIKVGIVGLGLIGSSILRGLYLKEEFELFVCSNSNFKNALEYTKNSSNDIKIVKDCDIVFVCSSISKTLETLNILNGFLNKNTIVVDVASIKSGLLDKKFNFNFILSHPMAGVENSGYEAGFRELFVESRWLIEKENEILNKIILELGAKPLVFDMKNHDKLTAQISHLPLVLAILLFDCASDDAKTIASSGFRDMTRLALCDSLFSLNLFKNEENILACFDIMVKKMNELKSMPDNQKIEYFKNIAEKRSKMYDKNGKNIFKI